MIRARIFPLLATIAFTSWSHAAASASAPATAGDAGQAEVVEAGTSGVDAENAASVETLRQLGHGLLRYLRARGKFPVMRNPLDWQARRTFYPYVGDERLFANPETALPYRWNEILSGKKPAHIINLQSFAVFFEQFPSRDGTRGVLFLDGHVERVIPAHWLRIAKASKLELKRIEVEEAEGKEEVR